MSLLETVATALAGWPFALGAIGVGALGGAALAVGLGRRGLPRLQDTGLADLHARRDSLFVELRELDDTRDKLDDALYDRERTRLRQSAADVLRALDVLGARDVAGGSAVVDARPRGAPSWSERNPRLSSVAWGVGAAVLVLALYQGLRDDTRARGANDGLTGGKAPADGGQVPDALAAKLARLEAAVAALPTNVKANNELGHLYIGLGRVMDAWKLAKEVVKIDPDDAEARVHQAVTLETIGDREMAKQLLDRVLVTNPDFAEALGYRGVHHARDGEREQAIALFMRGRAAEPAQAEVFSQLIARVDQMAARGAADAPPVPGEAGATAAEPAPTPTPATVEFAGEVRLPAGAAATGTVFVYVRAEGVMAGPPLRAKMLPAGGPLAFSITAADSPMGGTLPAGKVQVSARLDADGNAMTKDPADPASISAPVTVGATGLVLQLTVP